MEFGSTKCPLITNPEYKVTMNETQFAVHMGSYTPSLWITRVHLVKAGYTLRPSKPAVNALLVFNQSKRQIASLNSKDGVGDAEWLK